jgi:hypothetical protein
VLVYITTGRQHKAWTGQRSCDVTGSEVHPAAVPVSLEGVQELLEVAKELVIEIRKRKMQKNLERVIEINHE